MCICFLYSFTHFHFFVLFSFGLLTFKIFLSIIFSSVFLYFVQLTTTTTPCNSALPSLSTFVLTKGHKHGAGLRPTTALSENYQTIKQIGKTLKQTNKKENTQIKKETIKPLKLTLELKLCQSTWKSESKHLPLLAPTPVSEWVS